MPQWKCLMEVFRLLDKSNCQRCYEPTCMAFAAAVFKGQKRLSECPHLAEDVLSQFEERSGTPSPIGRDADNALNQLKRQVAAIDLSSAARRLGAEFSDGKLTLKILGKNFSVDSHGNLLTEIHINPWVAIPALTYILQGSDKPVSGKWLPFRELKNGMSWNGLFEQQCEKIFKKAADRHPEIFEDIVRLFNARQVENHYQSDISLILNPLPRIPVLICYWKPEDGLESSLNLFFDATAEEHLNIESIYTLGAGLSRMFDRITLRHGN